MKNPDTAMREGRSVQAGRTTRRRLLATTAMAAFMAPLLRPARARTVRGALPWQANEAYPPTRVERAGWLFFTADEAAMVQAMADRLIPPDDAFAGGAQAGCATFIDRQLAGPFGGNEGLYMQGPFARGTPSQGLQDERPPTVQYRQGLAAVAQHCRDKLGNRSFPALSGAEQDTLLAALEAGSAGIAGMDEKGFFELLLQNVMEGYFADPIYGGNRDMVGWKLVGFPGTRYDFREMLAHPGEPYTEPPVSLLGRAQVRP